MAGGIKDYLVSAKSYGSEFVEHFEHGSHGWKIWESKDGKYNLEIDNIICRDSLEYRGIDINEKTQEEVIVVEQKAIEPQVVLDEKITEWVDITNEDLFDLEPGMYKLDVNKDILDSGVNKEYAIHGDYEFTGVIKRSCSVSFSGKFFNNNKAITLSATGSDKYYSIKLSLINGIIHITNWVDYGYSPNLSFK